MSFCQERTFERPLGINARQLKNGKFVYGSQEAAEEETLGFSLVDVFSDVCVSGDGQWIAGVSREYRTVAVASRKSAVTFWTSYLGRDMRKQSFLPHKEIGFDPNGRHLLIFADGTIRAFAPAFCNGHRVAGT